MPTSTWFAALLDEIVPLILARPIRGLRWVRLARNGAISQYDVIFRTCTGSGGHANVYLIKTVSNGTLTNCSMVALVCLFRYFEVLTSPSEDEFFTVEAG